MDEMYGEKQAELLPCPHMVDLHGRSIRIEVFTEINTLSNESEFTAYPFIGDVYQPSSLLQLPPL